jgi:sialic acid synthase SpsE
MFIIAEVGNNHLGSLDAAKQYIKAYRDMGADAIKFQAIPETVNGSMPESFYQKCAFDLDQYSSLIDAGDSLGIPVFYSIFDNRFDALKDKQKYHKISAVQLNYSEYEDEDNLFVSVRNLELDRPELKNARMMWASLYLDPDPPLDNIRKLRDIYKRDVGYSDHTKGIDKCVEAVEEYGAKFIEKHVALGSVMHEGHLFRDSVHGANLGEFYELAKRIK